MNEQLVFFFPEDEDGNAQQAFSAEWDEDGSLSIHTEGYIGMDGTEPRQLLEFLKARLEPKLENE